MPGSGARNGRNLNGALISAVGLFALFTSNR